jgi:hypothetical protein
MDGKNVISRVAEMLKVAVEASVDVKQGAGEFACLFLGLDDRYSLCLSNAGDTWAADIADLANNDIVVFVETRLEVATTDAETLAGVFKVHLDLARLDLEPYWI